jgi:deoxyhypusine synthase
MKGNKRDPKNFSRGEGMIPLKPIDLMKIKTCDEILRAMELTSFGGRCLGEAAHVLHSMISDPECFRVLTLSGAMTVAQQGKIINDMVHQGWFNCVVSTGAVMAHGLIQGVGGIHHKAPPNIDATKLYHQGANLVYDTIELEANMDLAEKIVKAALLTADPSRVWSSWEICQAIGDYLNKQISSPAWSILKTARLKNVPIFIPAFTDSELALDIATSMEEQGGGIFNFNPFSDLNQYKDMILSAHRKGKKLGIFIIGGGVPRNWAQQVGPLLDIMMSRLGKDHGAFVRFNYGVRICTASVEEGGLSGCSFKEGVTWGKFVPKEEGGMTSEVITDATIVLPLLIRGVMERMGAV